MIKLNLNATTPEQKKIKLYLENNVSEMLADKINNGVQIVKDDKMLLSKKDLDGFMDFANDEARKLAEKGSKYACINDDTVYGWAIHYFEENSIEGKLYNADGTEYKAKTSVKGTTVTTIKKPEPQPKPQLSIFDMANNTAESAEITEQADDNELIENANDEVDGETENADYTPEELEEIYGEENAEPEPQQVKQFYQCYLNIQEMYADSIIAYRLGDFFEIYGKNAELLADELNLTLTGRDVGLKSRVPMIGLPYHAIDAYIPKITGKGYKIAVVEPQGEIVTYTAEIKSEQQTENVSYASASTEEDITLMREREIARAFDKNALIILSDLLGDCFIME